MPESLKAAALALAANAEARWSALVLGIFLLVYLVRKFLPQLWLRFEVHSPFVVADPQPVLALLHKTYQALPSVLLGAVIPAVLSGGDWKAAGRAGRSGCASARGLWWRCRHPPLGAPARVRPDPGPVVPGRRGL